MERQNLPAETKTLMYRPLNVCSLHNQLTLDRRLRLWQPQYVSV